MVIVAIASPKANTKVPEIDQILSAGATVHNLINAVHAQGFGAMWRTGEFAYDPAVRAGLGLHAEERIVGFVYVCTLADVRKASPPPEPAKFFTAGDGAPRSPASP